MTKLKVLIIILNRCRNSLDQVVTESAFCELNQFCMLRLTLSRKKAYNIVIVIYLTDYETHKSISRKLKKTLEEECYTNSRSESELQIKMSLSDALCILYTIWEAKT